MTVIEFLDTLAVTFLVIAAFFIPVVLLVWLYLMVLKYYPSDSMMQRINDQISMELDDWRKEVTYPIPNYLYGNYIVRCWLSETLTTQKKVRRLASRVLWYRPKKNHPYYRSIKMMHDAHIRNCELYIRELLDAYENSLKDNASMQ